MMVPTDFLNRVATNLQLTETAISACAVKSGTIETAKEFDTENDLL